jgi:hypothetical protein
VFYLLIEGDGFDDKLLKTEDLDKAMKLFLEAVAAGKYVRLSTDPIILDDEDFTCVD